MDAKVQQIISCDQREQTCVKWLRHPIATFIQYTIARVLAAWCSEVGLKDYAGQAAMREFLRLCKTLTYPVLSNLLNVHSLTQSVSAY